MADEKGPEGVYGENIAEGGLTDERGIREETVEAHPQPTGETASDPSGADATATVGSEGDTAKAIDAVQRDAAQATGSGGGGRAETPRNADDAGQGEFTPLEDKPSTPG